MNEKVSEIDRRVLERAKEIRVFMQRRVVWDAGITNGWFRLSSTLE